MNGRHALVIGAIAYPGQELENATSDAGHAADALRDRGFAVTTVFDPSLAAIDAALTNFKELAQTAELAVIFLAGHAVERHGRGYFLPI
ncbi:caspase family protein, partial [Mesorhizobium sp. M4B.F.Ca.ET.200.01.1.1]